MMASDEKFKQCVECIKADDLGGALLKLTNGVEWDAKRAARCLIELQSLIYSKVHVGKASLSSNLSDLYGVADYLCSLLKNYDYEYDVNKLLTCLYYIIRYLLDINEMAYAKDMCVFLLDVKNKYANESNVLCNQIFKLLYGAFCKSLCNVNIRPLLEVEDDEDNVDGAMPVIRYLMELWRCSFDLRENNGDIYLADLIAVFFIIVPKFETLNKCVIGFIYGPECLGYFFSKVCAVGYQNVVDSDATFVNLVKLFSNSVLSIIKFDRFCEINCVLKCVELSKNLYRNDDNKINYLSFYENFIGFVSLSLPHVDNKGRAIDSHMLKKLVVSFEKISKSENHDIFKVIYAFIVGTLQKLIIPSKENKKFEPLLNTLKKDSLDCLFDFFFCIYDVAVSECDNFNSYNLLMIVAYFVKNCVGFDGCQDSFEYCERTHRSLLSLLKRVCVQDQTQTDTLSLSNHCLVNIVNTCLMLHVSYVRLKLYDKCIRLSEEFFQLLTCFPQHLLGDLKAKCSFYNGLGVYCACCIELNRPLDGLRLLLVWKVVTADCGNRLMEMWVTIKSRHCPPHVAVLNADDIATEMRSNEQVKAKWNIGKHGNAWMDKVDWTHFVYSEIQAYHNKKNLQDEPLMKAFTSLQLLSSDTNLIGKASMYLLVSLSRNENCFKLSEPITTAMNAMLGKLTKKKKKTIEEECLMANLFHYSTRRNIYHARSIVEDELMVRADIKDEALRRDPVTGTIVDPIDCCEQAMVVDSAILLTSQESLMKELDQFMELIKNTILNRWQENGDGDLITISLNNINTTGLLYHLYGDHLSAADTWNLLYKVSRYRYPLVAIRGFIHLMNTGVPCFVINDFLDELKDEAPSAINSSDGGHDLEDFIYNYFNLSILNLNRNQLKDIYQMMLISLATYHLCDGRTADCFHLLMKVDQSSLNKLMYVNYLCTMSEFYIVQDSRDCMSDDDENYHSKTVNSMLDEAMTYVRHFIKEMMWDNYDDQCLLHTMLLRFVAKGSNYFCAIGWPQDALRCVKDEIAIAQKLALPVKTCELLINQSWIDFHSGKLYDCEFKLAHIEVILGLKKDRMVSANDSDDCCSPIIHSSAPRNDMPHSQSQHLFHAADTVLKACSTLSGMCVFVDLILVKSALASSRHTKLQSQICSVKRCFHYAEQMLCKLEARREGEGEQLSARRVLLYFHLANHLQSVGDASEALDYYDKCHASYKSSHIRSGTIAISLSDVQMRCASLRLKLLHTTFTDPRKWKQKKRQSRVVAVSPSAVSTPPCTSSPVSVFHPRILLYKTPSSNLNDENKLAATSSPGDVPHGFSRVCKQLVMENIDGKEEKENADSPVIKIKRNKNKPTLSRKPCASVDLNVNGLAKNLSKINIYKDSDDTDTVVTGPKKRTRSTSKPKKK